MCRPVERPHDKVDRAQPIAIDRARSFHVARWSLETGTSVPVAPVWTRATGRELVAIDRARFGKVSCGHGLSSVHYTTRRRFRNDGRPPLSSVLGGVTAESPAAIALFGC